jgi:Bacterial PH domain
MSITDQQSFRAKLPALWRQVFPIGIATALLVRVGSWLSGQPFSWPSTIPISLAAGLIVVAFYLMRPVQAGPAGLRLLNRLGFRRLVAWDDVCDVRFGRRQPLEPAFRLTDRRGKVYWIPRHTQGLRELQRMCMRFGGASHPLAVALETPVCDAP